MDLKSVIDKINVKNNATVFDHTKADKLNQFLLTLPNLTYLGHGGMCICLCRNGDEVVKCCRKKKNAIITSREVFQSRVDDLKKHKLAILFPLDILYEDEHWFVYTQPVCRLIERTELNAMMCSQMLALIEKMIHSNLKLTDIFYRNFGVYKNQLYLFDFHEIENFDSSSSFMVNNLYSTFILLGRNLGWHNSDAFAPHTQFPNNGDYGEYKFPSAVTKFLSAMRANDKSKMLDYMDRVQTLMKGQISRKYSDHNHQSVSIDGKGEISLSSHCLSKFQLTQALIKSRDIKTILEARCGIGGLSLKLAQSYPDIKITLSHTDQNELSQAKTIAQECLLYNVSTTVENKPTRHTPKYDLVLYYSSIHHLLKTQGIAELIADLKSMMSKYCVLEVPMMGDSLLDKVMRNSSQIVNFRCLSSPETFRYHLVSNDLKVLQCIRINYNRKDLIRYAYICGL